MSNVQEKKKETKPEDRTTEDIALSRPVDTENHRQDDKEKQRQRRKKKKRDRSAERVKGEMPAPPLSAYNFFFRAERLAGSDGKRDGLSNQEEEDSTEADAKGLSSFKTMTKSIGRKWRELPAEQKLAYEQLAKEDSERYRREIAEYNDEIIRSTKIGRATLEGRMQQTLSEQSKHGGGGDSKPPACESRIAAPEVSTDHRFSAFPTQQFARLPLDSNPQGLESATYPFRDLIETHLEHMGSLQLHHDALLRQKIADDILLQQMFPGIGQTSGSTFEQASAPSFLNLLSQLQTANASESERATDSALLRANLSDPIGRFQNSQTVEGLSRLLARSVTYDPQSTGAQGNAQWRQQHQIPNPGSHFPYTEQLPTIAEFLASINNHNQLAQFQIANQASARAQQALIQQLSAPDSSQRGATTRTINSQELLRHLEEEERRRQQK